MPLGSGEGTNVANAFVLPRGLLALLLAAGILACGSGGSAPLDASENPRDAAFEGRDATADADGSSESRDAQGDGSVPETELILFGGGSFRTGTWSWDGQVWNEVEAAGPGGRFGHGLVHDTARERAVLFGGDSEEHDVVGDTWEWDGASWQKVADSGPAPRLYHAMAYDAAREQVVVFGGYDYGANIEIGAETWTWDGKSWTLAAETGPPGRRSGAMAYDAARERVILFGGSLTGQYFGATWTWDGVQWEKVAEDGPAARHNHDLAYDPSRERVVLFGGRDEDGNLHADTWEWDGAGWEKVADRPPSPRGLHTLAYDEASDRVVLFGGGAAFVALDDMWAWDGRAWEELEITDGPATRAGHALSAAPRQ